MTLRGCLSALFMLAASCVTVGAQAADLTVLTAGAFKPILLRVQGEFERTTGNHLRITNGTAGELDRMVRGGAAFDMLIAPQGGFPPLASALQTQPPAALARVGIGVVVRQGTPIPDVSTVASLRRALLDAPSIAMIDPASGGSSGPAVMALFARLGITDQVKDHLVLKQGGAVADLVAERKAAIGLHQISEILPVAGVVLAGPLPAEVQSYTTYAAAVGNRASNAAGAEALIAALHGPAAVAAITAAGMTPERE